MSAQLYGLLADDVSAATRVTRGIAQGTSVMTADGVLPVEHLAPGDRIITREGLRVLVDVTVQVAVGNVIRVSASSLGHARPEEDVILGAETPLLVRDWRAKALFGAAQAIVPVQRLIDGELIRVEKVSGLRMYELSFASSQVIFAGGLEVACDAVPVSV
jgi:hypothetical protein